MFQAILTSYGQSLINNLVNIDGILAIYDYIANIPSLTSYSSYTVTLDEDSVGNFKGSIANIRIQDLSSTEYQVRTILFYKIDNNTKKIVAGYSQEDPIIRKTSDYLNVFLTFDFSCFTNGFIFSSIQASLPTASHNSDGIVHIENPSIESDDSYSIYSKSQVDSLLNSSVGNGTLTIQKNGTQVATFNANSSSNTTANITVPPDLNSAELIGGFVRYNVSGSGNLTIQNTYGLFPYSSGTTTTLPAGTYLLRVRLRSATLSYSVTVNFGTSYTVSTTNGVIDDVRSITLSSAQGFSATITTVTAGTYIRVVIYEPDSVISSGTVGAAAITNDYNDLNNIPNGTLVIQKNGSNIASFSASADSNVIANITVPTNIPTSIADLTIDGSIIPDIDEDYDIGDPDHKWDVVYANTFSGDLTGNAGTASTLETSRNIDGVSFNGGANVTHYGTCSTAANIQIKDVTIPNFSLTTGARVVVKFSNSNTAANPQLRVNTSGTNGTAKAIKYSGTQSVTSEYYYKWLAGNVVEFIYDGTNYVWVGFREYARTSEYSYTLADQEGEGEIIYGTYYHEGEDDEATVFFSSTSIVPTTTSYYDLGKSDLKWNNVYADNLHSTTIETISQVGPYVECSTGSGIVKKEVTIPNFKFESGSRLLVKFLYDHSNGTAPTLCIHDVSGDTGTTYPIKLSTSYTASYISYYDWLPGQIIELVFYKDSSNDANSCWYRVGWQYYTKTSDTSSQAGYLAYGTTSVAQGYYSNPTRAITPYSTFSTNSYLGISTNYWQGGYIHDIYFGDVNSDANTTYTASLKQYNSDTTNYKNGIVCTGNFIPYSNSYSLGSSSKLWDHIYGNVIHAIGEGPSDGLILCDASECEESAYSAISGYQDEYDGQMIFHHYNAVDGIDYTVTSTGPLTRDTSESPKQLETLPETDDSWRVGSPGRRLKFVYATTFYGNLGSSSSPTSQTYIDSVNQTVVTCSTAVGTNAKTATLTGFTLVAGARILVKFTNGNSATSPTLNITTATGTTTGAKSINNLSTSLASNSVVPLIYNGSSWDVEGSGLNFASSSSIPTNYVTTNTAQNISANKTFTGSTGIILSTSSGESGSIKGGTHTESSTTVRDINISLSDANGRINFKNSSGTVIAYFSGDNLYFSRTHSILPVSSNAVDLGSSSYQWRNIYSSYIGDSSNPSYLYGSISGNAATATSATTADTAKQLEFSSTLKLLAGAYGWISSHDIYPDSSNTYASLGESNQRWNYLYCNYIGLSSYPVTTTYTTNLYVNGVSVTPSSYVTRILGVTNGSAVSRNVYSNTGGTYTSTSIQRYGLGYTAGGTDTEGSIISYAIGWYIGGTTESSAASSGTVGSVRLLVVKTTSSWSSKTGIYISGSICRSAYLRTLASDSETNIRVDGTKTSTDTYNGTWKSLHAIGDISSGNSLVVLAVRIA